ncbi:dTDP-4-dehydrorhamnose 3,5-epimerase [Micromonospora sp. NPDC050980]|uniref:dTDP-4-dehydrorhamnose 3,5-epimerase family protein n=1 Tax=Micromonospora sp. NPDC050980 TaxID=3155161 RepID=UPI0033C6FFF3
MEIQPLSVLDAYRIVPSKLTDERGCFYESLRRDRLLAATGHAFTARQANFSVSRRGTLRGIHGVRLPPGQAKVVNCVRGAVLDIVVDLRLDSPTFGTHAVNRLDADGGVAVFVAEGLGHGFVALTDDACVGYLCSTTYVPGTPLEVNPLDPELALPWQLAGPPLMSRKDAEAPGLAEAIRAGLLPTYAQCRAVYDRQRAARH